MSTVPVRQRADSRQLVALLLSVTGPALIIGAWELAARQGVIDDRFWPPPSTLWQTATRMAAEGSLWADTRITVVRILLGFALGAIPGIVLGLGMGLFWPVRAFFTPIATVIYAIPKIAILPLTLIAFGTGETAILFTVAISIVFLVAVSAMGGVLELEPTFRDVGRNLGATRLQMFRTVALPGAMPAIFTGLRLALGFALVVVVGTEFVNARNGLGYLIWNSYQTLLIRQLFAGLLATGALGLVLTAALGLLESALMPWRSGACSHASWRSWLRAVRPFSFTTSTIPVIAASMLAFVHGDVRWGFLVLMLLASVATHAACNLTNDYFDAMHGVDSDATLGQGGSLQSGDLTFGDLQLGITLCFGAALIFALPIIADVGEVVLWIAILSALAAFLYTGGPFPLAYFGLGEVTVFLAMGVGMVVGTYYVHSGTVTASSLLLGVAMGLLAAGFLHANNVRDISTDRQHGKRTLANLLPRPIVTREFAVLELVPFALAIVMIIVDPRLVAIAITAVLIPRAIGLIRVMASEREPAQLNPVVRKAAGLHLGYGTLISLALLGTGLWG